MKQSQGKTYVHAHPKTQILFGVYRSFVGFRTKEDTRVQFSRRWMEEFSRMVMGEEAMHFWSRPVRFDLQERHDKPPPVNLVTQD